MKLILDIMSVIIVAGCIAFVVLQLWPRKKIMGCLNCKYRTTKYGETHCEWQPHKYNAPMQKAIVEWLSTPVRDAMKDDGCPGFENYNAKQTKY